MILHLPNRYKVPGSIPKVGRVGHKGKGGGREEERKRKGQRTGKKGGNHLTSNTLLLHMSHLTMRTTGEALLHAPAWRSDSSLKPVSECSALADWRGSPNNPLIGT